MDLDISRSLITRISFIFKTIPQVQILIKCFLRQCCSAVLKAIVGAECHKAEEVMKQLEAFVHREDGVKAEAKCAILKLIASSNEEMTIRN